MKVIVNGTERELADGTTVLSLLESLRLSPDKVAVELNRRLLRSANYDRVLQSGDQIEVVTFVGGG